MTLLGLNAGFYDILGPQELMNIKRLPCKRIRRGLIIDRTPTVEEVSKVGTIVSEGLAFDVDTMYIGGRGDIPLLPAQHKAEFLNEPIFKHNGNWSAKDYAAAVREVREAAPDVDLFIGSVHNLDKKNLDWLGEAMSLLPAEMGYSISFHRYAVRPDRPREARKGFKTRQEEMEYLLKVANGRSLACTEFGGYHLASFKYGCFGRDRKRITEWEQFSSTLYDLDIFNQFGIDLAYYYQYNDGTEDVWGDRQGIRTREGHVNQTFGPFHEVKHIFDRWGA